ncbi:MAG TPA: Gfo/Idh/MocA family oxidoreductase [Candidatus Sulfopaludibacter sp.]|nr:Gfo/Idh/MocA family oxidoreductase [Candidatus Sulfopaludibacter sp.]
MRMAVLGLGFMGSTHVKALGSVRGAELAAVYSSDPRKLAGDLSAVQGNLGGRGEKLDFSGLGQYSEMEALLADPTIDAVDICLPTDLHEGTALAALAAGKHVLVEKPMALDGAGAERMLRAAQAAGRVLMTAQVLRFFPQYMCLEQALRGGELGRPRFAIFRRRCAAPAWGGWLLDPARSGGGAFDLLIHDADMCLHLFGKPEAVAALGAEDAGIGVDCIDAQLFYAGGSVAVIAGGWYGRGEYPFSMEYSVVLEGGSIEYGSSGPAPTLYPRNGPGQELPLEARDGYAAEIQYFAECCSVGLTPERCAPADSALAVKLMLLLLESRTRKGAKLPCNL